MAYGIKVNFDRKIFQQKCEKHAKNLAFITFEEASAITKEYGRGYGVPTLYKEKHKGALLAKKFAGHVYVDWSMLLDFLERKAA